MRTSNLAVPMLFLFLFSAASSADADLRVIASGEVRPGVYGRIELGNNPPPPLVYEKPIVIVRQPATVAVRPIYLHVPPGHAKKWSKHCQQYNACGQPVYFVRSDEYGPAKGKKGKKGK